MSLLQLLGELRDGIVRLTDEREEWESIAMAQKILCERCGTTLTKPGALVFGPPAADSTCTKWHLCEDCFNALDAWVSRL